MPINRWHNYIESEPGNRFSQWTTSENKETSYATDSGCENGDDQYVDIIKLALCQRHCENTRTIKIITKNTKKESKKNKTETKAFHREIFKKRYPSTIAYLRGSIFLCSHRWIQNTIFFQRERERDTHTWIVSHADDVGFDFGFGSLCDRMQVHQHKRPAHQNHSYSWVKETKYKYLSGDVSENRDYFAEAGLE